MAIKKKMVEPMVPDSMPLEDSHCDACCNECSRQWSGEFGKKILWTLAGVLIVYLIFYVGTLTRNGIKEFNYVGQADQNERTLTVTGYGKMAGSNDIAMTSIGYSNVDVDVSKAQQNNKKVMDSIMSDLKKMGIEEKDLQSNYSIYPEYNYSQDKGQELKGYRVSNTVAVKIRNLSKIPDVLGLAGKYGANQVNGLTFTIDDPENLRNTARDKALVDAKAKAEALAAKLGVQLVAVISYNEFEAGGFISPVYNMTEKAVGMGGGAPDQVAGGSQDVAMNVNITYKIVSGY